MACHQRSTSLPSMPRSTDSSSVGQEQELQALKVGASSPSATIETTRDGLRRLGDLYSRVEKTLHLPSNQLALRRRLTQQQQGKTAAEEELDRSLALIDLCGATQESLAELRTRVQDLRLAFRRGDAADGGAGIQLKAESFVRLARKARRPPLKKTTAGNGKATAEDGCRVVRLMAEARETAARLLESVSRLLPEQIGSLNPNASRWSLVSKRFRKREAVCEVEERQLQALERGVGDLADGVDVLFRRLIQCRVALLNILSS
ncbi:hypothetical protein ZEAMMB73_Zm00001d004862 [Zea mays]|uniref:DUF241 domain protein n=1 Tax=Zea mays TaxID=4577 RepID=A0A1D6EHV5_MAIZE|nr:hypothetical protein ZEAMMB73_Zm00001d004862 [Zea mays]|eukprot:XP_008669832.1 uncharacterized protein LOC103647039 [Zea mays]